VHFTTAIFDMDGTLLDTERLAIDALQAAFREYDLDIPRQTLETVIGSGGEEARRFLSPFSPIGVGIDEILRRTGTITKGYIEQHGLPVKPGVVELLTRLSDLEITIGLATSTSTERALDNLHRSNLAGYFRSVIGGDQVERCKPHPDIYLKALSELGVAPDEAIAPEDSDHGIRSAFTAGLRVIHIPDIKRIDEDTKGMVHRQYATLLEFRDEIALILC